MKIESVKVNFTVADSISRDNINERLAEVVADPEAGFYGVEIEEDVKAAAESGVKVTRRKMADGTTIENRDNCQGGGAV